MIIFGIFKCFTNSRISLENCQGITIYGSPITPYILLPLVKSIEQWGQQVLEVLKQLGGRSSFQKVYSWVRDPLADPFMEYVRH